MLSIDCAPERFAGDKLPFAGDRSPAIAHRRALRGAHPIVEGEMADGALACIARSRLSGGPTAARLRSSLGVATSAKIACTSALVRNLRNRNVARYWVRRSGASNSAAFVALCSAARRPWLFVATQLSGACRVSFACGPVPLRANFVRFVRCRGGATDWQRTNRQGSLICLLRKRIVVAASPSSSCWW